MKSVGYEKRMKYENTLIISKYTTSYICESLYEITQSFSCDYGIDKFHKEDSFCYSCNKKNIIDYLKDQCDGNNSVAPFLLGEETVEASEYIKYMFFELKKEIPSEYDLMIGLEIIEIKKANISKRNNLLSKVRYITITYLIKRNDDIIANDFMVFDELNANSMNEFINETIYDFTWNRSHKKEFTFSLNSNILFNNKAAGVLFHECVGHFLEADNYINSTLNSDNICDDSITVYENFNEKSEYDDMGNKIKKDVMLIKNGKINSLLTDANFSNILNCHNTGNAITETPDALPSIRMRNMYVKEGMEKREKIISGITNGLYVDNISYGEVNYYSGDFFLMPSRSMLIHNGLIKESITNIPLHFNIKQFNQWKIQLCDDPITIHSLCLKMGAAKKVAFTAPSMLLQPRKEL